MESFFVQIQPEESFQYRWTVAFDDKKQKNLRMMINVFSQISGDDFAYMQNVQE